MKKFIAIISLLLISLTSYAQSAFQQGDVLVSVGTSFIFYRNLENGNFSRAGTIIPAVAYAEYAINDILGLGMYGAFTSRKFKNVVSIQTIEDDFVFRTYYYNLGLRATLHLTPTLEEFTGSHLHSDRVDYYLAGLAGFEWKKYEDNQLETERTFTPGVAAGVRYYFSPTWGLFGEVGLGITGIATIGITGRFY